MRARSLALIALLALCVSACAYQDRTTMVGGPKPPPIAQPENNSKWREKDPDPEVLSIVAASGGGTRAATFLLGILKKLDSLCLEGAGPNDQCSGFSALDHVDMVSSVSGSSLTAGYWATFGKDKFWNLEQHLRNSGFWDIFWRFAHPESSIGNWFPPRAAIDVLADRFKEDDGFEGVPFGDRTFSMLPRRPRLILNATDVAAGSTFAFTPQNFYFICSRLDQFKIAEAIAASAAFPIAFGAMTLRNHTYNADENRKTCPEFQEPAWIERTLTDGVARLVGDRSEFRRAERLKKYAAGDCGFEGETKGDPFSDPYCVEWLHLLDGGIVDNLGLSEPFWIMTNVHAEVDPAAPYGTRPPSKETQFIEASEVVRIYEGITKQVVILIANVRANPESDIGTTGDNPGWLPQALGVSGGSIDAVSDLLIGKVANPSNIRNALLEEVCEYLDLSEGCIKDARAPDPADDPTRCQSEPEGPKLEKIKHRIRCLPITIVPLDFDLIGRNTEGLGEDQIKLRTQVRRYAQSIPTTWWLDKNQIDFLLELPNCLMSEAAAVDDIVDGLIRAGRMTQEQGQEMLRNIRKACNYKLLADIAQTKK